MRRENAMGTWVCMLALASALAMSSCETTPTAGPPTTTEAILGQWAQLENGMTKNDVAALLGPPSAMFIRSHVEEWEYGAYPGVRGFGYVRFDRSTNKVRQVTVPTFRSR